MKREREREREKTRLVHGSSHERRKRVITTSHRQSSCVGHEGVVVTKGKGKESHALSFSQQRSMQHTSTNTTHNQSNRSKMADVNQLMKTPGEPEEEGAMA